MQYKEFSADHPVPDNRFRDLVGHKAWDALPDAVKKRFSRKMRGGASVVYRGEVIAMRMNIAGRMLAQLARLIGAPLPYDMSSINLPAVVSVTEDMAGDGQFWIRQYGRASGFPQIIHSSKRFTGPSGVEEYIGCGLGIALQVSAEPNRLVFRSDHYFAQIAGFKLRLPRWMQPGKLEIGHEDIGSGRFIFSLALRSRLLGELIAQDALFADQVDSA